MSNGQAAGAGSIFHFFCCQALQDDRLAGTMDLSKDTSHQNVVKSVNFSYKSAELQVMQEYH